jgi:PAS domain S-box-containing protein
MSVPSRAGDAPRGPDSSEVAGAVPRGPEHAVDSAAVLGKCSAIVRRLCEGPTQETLTGVAAMLEELPGVDGVLIEHEGGVVRSGSDEQPSRSFPLGADPALGRLVVHGAAAAEPFTYAAGDRAQSAGTAPAPSATEAALEVVVPVMTGVLRQQRTAKVLEERQRTSRAVVDTALDAIVTMGADGLIRDFNPAAEQIFGHRREDVVGRRLAEVLVPASLREAHAAGLERYLRTRRGRILGKRVEMPALRADGAVITVELAIVPTTGEDGLVFTAFLRDVTDARGIQRRLEDTTSRLGTLIASLHAAVLVEDEKRRIVLTNEAFTSMFEIPAPPEALLGADCSNAAEDSKHLFVDPDGFVSSVDRRLADRRLTTGEEFATRDGRVLERDYVPVFRGEEYLGHLWLYRDITDRKQAERRLEEQNRMLADLARMKDRFVATVSHELRTPLTAVIGFTEILGRPETGPLTEDQRTYLEVVERNAQQLQHLGNDLLTVMSVESGGLHLDVGPLDVPELVSAVVHDHGARAEERGVRMRTRLPERLAAEGDAARLRQVLDNLVGNAVKYTPRGGEVGVAAEVVDGHWRLEVRDTGIGIPQADRDRLFTSFFRASNTRSGVTPGTGLGLVIARAIVELHHGSISLASKEGRGTTVTVTLPVEVPADERVVPT